MSHARPDKTRPPFFAIAALCLALLGLSLPRLGGPIDPASVFASGVAAVEAGRTADLAQRPSPSDLAGEGTTDRSTEHLPGYSAPVAIAVDDAAVLQRATESLQRLQLELEWAKARTLPAHARYDAHRLLVAGDPVRVAERDVAAQASPLLRWCLAHSTSSAIG